MNDATTEALSVFVVDDDEALRRTLRGLLEHEGFRVLEAGGAAEAESVLEASDEHIDVVLMDIHLPDGWGAAVAHRLKAERPEMATVFSTGYAANDPILASGLTHVEWRLQKPFTRDQLVTTLRRAVAAHRGNSPEPL